MKTLNLILFCLLSCFNYVLSDQTDTKDVLKNYLITNEDDLKAGLSRFMPNVIAIRNPQSVSEELPEQFEQLRTKLFMKGVKTNIFYCEKTLPIGVTELYLSVLQAFCQSFDEAWKFAAAPYYEDEAMSNINLNHLDDALSRENHDVVEAYLLEKLKILRTVGQPAATGLAFHETLEAAARSVLNSYPNLVNVLQEEHVVSFLTNMAQYGKREVKVADDIVMRDSYPVIFFSEEKVSAPPQILETFASFTSGLASVGFVHNPKGELMKNIGLPPEFIGKNVLLTFSLVNGQLQSYMYDKQLFGKYTAVSMLGFFFNVVHPLKVPGLQQEQSSFELWENTGANRLRLPMQYNLGETEEEERDSGATVEFEKRDISLETQLTTESFGECFNETAICLLALLDRFSTDASSQIATLVALQDSFYDQTSLIGKSRLLPFKVHFVWLDSVCNRAVVEHLKVDATSVPTLVSLFHSSSGKAFSMKMVKAFNVDNAVSFVREQFKYRKLLTASEEDKQFKKYINRFSAVDKSLLVLREECEEGIGGEEEEEIGDLLKEIQEEERRERELREQEEKQREKKKKKKKKKKRKKKKEL